MKTLSLFLLLGLCVACSTNSDKQNAASQSSEIPNSFGWTEQKKNELLNECMERYKIKDTPKSTVNKDEYCNCLTEKITISIQWEDYNTSNYNAIKKIEDFGKICETLTTVGK